MKKIKNWFINRFLPMWAKETVLRDNRRLTDENEALRYKIEELEAYINGLHIGIKNQRRIVINNEVVKK